MGTEEDNYRENYIKTIFEHNQSLIKLADDKANIILGIDSILMPLIFGVTAINLVDLIIANIILNAIILNSFFIVSLILLSISFVFAVLVIKARISIEHVNNIFFKHILTNDISGFRQKILGMKREEIFKDYLTEIYALAKINDEKYEKYKLSLWMLIAGVSSLVTGFIIIAIINYPLIFTFNRGF